MPVLLFGTAGGAITTIVLSSGLSRIGSLLVVQFGACAGALAAALIMYSR
jgi:hypothetical protein